MSALVKATKLIRHISRWISWPVAITIFIVAIGSYLLYFNYSEPLKDLVRGQHILDKRGSGYDLEYVRELLDVMREEGRALYMRTTLPGTVYGILCWRSEHRNVVCSICTHNHQ